jgi:hypothetical protein
MLKRLRQLALLLLILSVATVASAATTFQWTAPESLTSALTTELNSLADSTSDTTGFSGLSSEIANETNLYKYIALELVVATQGSARSAGAFVSVYIVYAADGTTYSDSANKLFSEELTRFPLDASTTARRLTKVGIPILPLDFKLYVLNDTGQAFASSGNTLKYRRHNEGAP